MAELTQGIDHTKGPPEVRDYGEPVLLAAAECQFALLDGPDGIPVAYVYREEDARLYAAAPDLLEAVWALIEHFERVDGNAEHKAVIAKGTAAIARATTDGGR